MISTTSKSQKSVKLRSVLFAGDSTLCLLLGPSFHDAASLSHATASLSKLPTTSHHITPIVPEPIEQSAKYDPPPCRPFRRPESCSDMPASTSACQCQGPPWTLEGISPALPKILRDYGTFEVNYEAPSVGGPIRCPASSFWQNPPPLAFLADFCKILTLLCHGPSHRSACPSHPAKILKCRLSDCFPIILLLTRQVIIRRLLTSIPPFIFPMSAVRRLQTSMFDLNHQTFALISLQSPQTHQYRRNNFLLTPF